MMPTRYTSGVALGVAVIVVMVAATVAEAQLHVRVRGQAINTTAETNVLASTETPPSHKGRYILQLTGPVTQQQRNELARAGVKLGAYIPDHAYVVQVDASQLSRVAPLDFVHWMGPIRKEWKTAPGIGTRRLQTPHRKALAARGLEQLIVTVFAGEDVKQAAHELTAKGAQVLLAHEVGGRGIVEVLMPAGQAATLAEVDAVKSIEEAPEATLRNDTNAWIVQSNVEIDGVGQTPVWDQGIHGEGQIGGLLDGRFYRSHCMFDDPEVPSPGPDHRKIVAYRGTSGSNSHGTHTAGTFVGDEEPYGEANNYDGIAFAARVSFGDYYPVFINPSITYAAFEAAHHDGAFVHSNSWGDDGDTDYTVRCRQIDEYMWDYEYDLVVFAATNGLYLQAPENAKNLLAVVATRDTPDQDEHCIGGEGPTIDGRRKPEIMAPGCATYSARSGTACDVRASTGTSMACPVIAGAGLLARQYYVDGYYPTGTPVPENAVVPTGALLKATLVNAAVDMTAITGYPSDQEGWGRLLLDNTLYFPGDTATLYVEDVVNSNGLSTGEEQSYAFEVSGDSVPLRVTLAWTDYPADAYAEDAAVNNLDLVVTAPNCDEYKGNVFTSGESATGGSYDEINNLEQVHLLAPVPGTYSVTIRGAAVNQATQGFALVVTGDIGTPLADCNENGMTDACESFGYGDWNRDGVVDAIDLGALEDCLAGPASPPAPARSECAAACLDAFDFHTDGDIALDDFAEFQGLYDSGD